MSCLFDQSSHPNKSLGWIIQWTSSTGALNKYIMEGLMLRVAFTPTTFQITSTATTQSALWVGRIGQLEITKVVQFKNTDVFFSSTITIKNIGSSTISNLYCKSIFFSFHYITSLCFALLVFLKNNNKLLINKQIS